MVQKALVTSNTKSQFHLTLQVGWYGRFSFSSVQGKEHQNNILLSSFLFLHFFTYPCIYFSFHVVALCSKLCLSCFTIPELLEVGCFCYVADGDMSKHPTQSKEYCSLF